jgi:hypothetical protein
MGRNSVDATNAFLIRSAAAEGRRFRLTLDFFPLVVVVFLAEEVFDEALFDEAVGFD